MATDIKISELNEITANDDINYIIVNDRENAGDEGITKKITLENFLTPNIVQETNILNNAVTNDKIKDLAVDCSKIASNTITCNQILEGTINNPSLASNSVDNRVLNNNCNFTVKGLLVNDGCINISNPATGCLNVVSGVTRLNGLNYNWPSSQVADKFLKTDGAGNLSWQEAVPGESTALVFAEIMPVGTIIPWGGIGDVPDDKWLPCDGRSFNGPEFPELSAAIGENFGARISDQFKVPDLRGRVPLGETEPPGNSDGTNTCEFSLGAKGGEYNHQLTVSEMPSHSHNINTSAIFSTRDEPPNNTVDLIVGSALGSAASCQTGSSCLNSICNYINTCGGNQTHNNIQPYIVTRYIIKARPDDIEQFNPEITPGLSAKNADGPQANITLNTTEIGLKVTDDFQFDTGGRLELSTPITSTLSRNIKQTINRYSYEYYGSNTADWTPIYAAPEFLGLQMGMGVVITPKFSTSKLLVSFTVACGGNSGHSPIIKLFRNNAEIPELINDFPHSNSRFKDGTAGGSYSNYYTTPSVSFTFLDDNSGNGFIAGVPVVYALKQNSYYSGYVYHINRATGNNIWSQSVVSTIEVEEIYQ